MNTLERRCIDLSYRHKLTHVSSVLNTVNLLAEIYERRKPDDPVVLANGHAGLALYVCLENIGMCDAEEMIHKHGVHPSRDMEHGIYCSSGSLGQAETVALGYALADPHRIVWLVTSDGACAEGSVWEMARIASHRAPNLLAWIIYNGLGAYGTIRATDLPTQFGWRIHAVNTMKYPEWLRGLAGHYLILTQDQYVELIST